MTVTIRIPIAAPNVSHCSNAILGVSGLSAAALPAGPGKMKNALLREYSRRSAFAFGWDVGLAALCITLLAHQQMVGDHNGFALLVNDVEMLGHDALVCMFLMIFLVADGNHRMNGVADIDRLDEA